MRTFIACCLVAAVTLGCDAPLALEDPGGGGTIPQTIVPREVSPNLQASAAGALIRNVGSKDTGFWCQSMGFITYDRITAVRAPSGAATLSCHFENLPPLNNLERARGFACTLEGWGPARSFTTKTTWVRTPAGRATLTCQFDE